MQGRVGIEMYNGVKFCVQKYKKCKLPALTVEIDGEIYKVATFESELKAKWFCEVFEEAVGDCTESE